MRTLLIVTTTLLLLSGCTTDDGDDDGMDHGDGMMLDDDSYTLFASGAPENATAGEPFTFQLEITGMAGTTTHLGGHFWDFPTQDPTNDFSDAGGCAHAAGENDLPGGFVVTCTIQTEGTYTLYGHLRMEEADTQYNFWSEPMTVNVEMDPAMS